MSEDSKHNLDFVTDIMTSGQKYFVIAMMDDTISENVYIHFFHYKMDADDIQRIEYVLNHLKLNVIKNNEN